MVVYWLKKNREIYNKYLEREGEEPKLLLAVGVGFVGYTEESARLARMLPLEWFRTCLIERKKAYPKFKEEVKKILEHFGERSVLYRCEICLDLFDKMKKTKKISNHIIVDHHRNESEEILIREVDKAYYLELLIKVLHFGS